MTTVDQLTQVFSDNFVAYTRSHIAHLNVTGRNFYSDHKLLNNIYDDLQDEIDVLGELIRSCGAFAPASIIDIVQMSYIDSGDIDGSADELLSEVRDDLILPFSPGLIGSLGHSGTAHPHIAEQLLINKSTLPVLVNSYVVSTF